MFINHQYNNLVILVSILILGLGFALALPWLGGIQSLASDGNPNESSEIQELVHIKEPASADTLKVNTSSAPITHSCYALLDNTLFLSDNASAVRNAILNASPGDIIKLAGNCTGVYTLAGITQTVYIDKRITLQGGYQPPNWNAEPDPDTYTTTLNANGLGRVVVISGTEGVTLDSLYLTGGVADDFTLDNNGGGIWSNSEYTLTNSIVYSNTAEWGGGMYNFRVSPVVSNVTFTKNSASSGGAMYNLASYGSSSPILVSVTFSGNTAGSGGAINNNADHGSASPILTNVTFIKNSANSGGAMANSSYLGTANSVLMDVSFISNTASTGGAISNGGVKGTSSPSLTNVIFLANSASTNGGALYNSGGEVSFTNPEMVNVLFSGNSAGNKGGAIYNQSWMRSVTSPLLTNVTFSGNTAGSFGGAMYNNEISGRTNPDVRNSIFWRNQTISTTGTTSDTIANIGGAVISLTHSLLEGSGGSSSWVLPSNYANGGGNIDQDPMFLSPVDPSNSPTSEGNLHLSSTSPAINTGKNEFVTVSTDLDNNPRIIAGIVDMGAYEALPYCHLPLIIR